MKVKIYILIDPDTLKIRYIGRTTVSLPMRLSQHIHRALRTSESTHKANWIRKLNKENKRPLIRTLTTITGWGESHVLERFLINKYRDRLLNHNDRGEGGKNVQVSQARRNQISETLKYKYKNKIIKHPMQFDVHVYNMKGEYIITYPSVVETAIALGLNRSQIDKVLSGLHIQSKGYRFSRLKLDFLEDKSSHKKGNYKRQCNMSPS